MCKAFDLQEEKLAACLEAEYRISPTDITRLALGADVRTTVYRVVAEDQVQYFLKVRHGRFRTSTVTVPHRLSEAGMQRVISPIATRTSGALWSTLDAFTIILYPFVPGHSGWDVQLSHRQWAELGNALRTLHTADIPEELRGTISRESYSAEWRERVRGFLRMARDEDFGDPVAAELAALLTERRTTIHYIVERSAQLADALARRSLPVCLCHGDIHAGNVLVDGMGGVRIVDWDTLLVAPKERDLMFIGGGIGGVWDQDHEVDWFYEGYGERAIDMEAIAYYRYERVVQDVGETCEELLLMSDGGDEHAEMLEQLAAHFEPGSVVDIALDTDQRSSREQ